MIRFFWSKRIIQTIWRSLLKNLWDNKKKALGLLIPILGLIVWQILYERGGLPKSQSSSPIIIIKTLRQLFSAWDFPKNLGISFVRLVSGVLIGSFLGIVLGIITSLVQYLRYLLNPMIQYFSGVPVIVWIPFWIMIFGIEESFKIGLVGIVSFFLVYGGVFQSISSIDNEYMELAKLYRKNYYQIITQLYLPYSKHSVYGAIRNSFILGWIVIFFVEYSVAKEGKEGLGWFIANARGVGRIEDEFAGLISLGIIAFFTDLILEYYQRRSIRWKK